MKKNLLLFAIALCVAISGIAHIFMVFNAKEISVIILYTIAQTVIKDIKTAYFTVLGI